MLVVFTFMSETEYSISVIVATRNSGITCQERTILRTKRLIHSLLVSYLTTRDGSPDQNFDVPLLNKKNTAQLSSDDVEVKTNTCLLTHSPAREYPGLFLLSYLNCVSSWLNAKTTVAWMRRGIKNLQSIIAACKEEVNSSKDTGRSRNEQGKQFLPLSVEELVHSEKFILRCLQCQYFNQEMEYTPTGQ